MDTFAYSYTSYILGSNVWHTPIYRWNFRGSLFSQWLWNVAGFLNYSLRFLSV